jgi:hypothetical protein
MDGDQAVFMLDMWKVLYLNLDRSRSSIYPGFVMFLFQKVFNGCFIQYLRGADGRVVALPNCESLTAGACAGSIVQIRAAFQILKEMVNKTEKRDLKMRSGGTDIVQHDVPKSLMECTSMTLPETIDHLNHQVLLLSRSRCLDYFVAKPSL